MRLSDLDFQKLSAFIYDKCGIHLPLEKKYLLEGRLQKRVRDLRMPSMKEYIHYLFHPLHSQSEIAHFIDLVTTNTTYFFREENHFNFLTQTLVPELVQLLGKKTHLNIWSSACSSGDEPYSIAMAMEELIEENPHLDLNYQILASDISTQILGMATQALYPMERLDKIPERYRKKYLLKGKGTMKGLFKIRPKLRNKIQFQQINLMDADFDISKRFDLIFCRNVLIYFDKKTQESLANKFFKYVKEGGYLFIGHSESLTRMNVPFKAVAPTVYRKVERRQK